MTRTILIVEDNRICARMIANWLIKNGMDARYVLSMDAAKVFLVRNEVDMVLSTYRIEEINSMELLEWMKMKGFQIPFFIMASNANISEAVEAIKKGADNYLPKPILSEKVLNNIQKELDGRENRKKGLFDIYIGKSPLAVKLQEYIHVVAPADTMAVLIRGASGTGKEYVAWQIHALSQRADAPFVAVDCGTLPKELAASELFGHVKGAFTNAVENKMGMFALANHGTLFLDEVGNLEMDVQMQLLRALQEKRYRPVGSREEIKANIRLIAATNENLEKAIAEGRFREDLFHRLNEFPLQVPLLMECLEDIIPLAEFMLEIANKEFRKDVRGFDKETLKKLQSYSWPGNIRELRSTVRKAVLLAKDNWITASDMMLPTNIQKEKFVLNDERVERENIIKALETTGNNRKAAAQLLKISRSTLYLKMKKYRLSVLLSK